jgi:hypothetical protein
MKKSNFVQCFSMQYLAFPALFVFEMPIVEMSGFFSLAMYFLLFFWICVCALSCAL